MTDLAAELRTMRTRIGAVAPRPGVAEVAEHPDLYPGLHERLEWDDAKAGPEYRAIQLGQIIRRITVSYTDSAGARQRTRGWVSVTREDDEAEREYRPVEEVAEAPFLRELMLRDAEREWRSLFQKYEHLSEFVKMVRGDVA